MNATQRNATQRNATRLTTILALSIGISLLVLNTGFAYVKLVGTCEEIIRNLQNEIQDIKGNIDSVRIPLEKRTKERDALQLKLPKIKADLETAIQRSNDLQNQLYAFAQQSDDVKTTLNQNSADFSAAENNLLDLKNKLAINQKQQKSHLVKATVKAGLTDKEIELKKAIDDAQKKYDAAKAKKDNQQGGWETLQTQAKDAQQQVADLQTKLSQTTADLEHTKKLVGAFTENLAYYEDKYNARVPYTQTTTVTQLEWNEKQLASYQKMCNK